MSWCHDRCYHCCAHSPAHHGFTSCCLFQTCWHQNQEALDSLHMPTVKFARMVLGDVSGLGMIVLRLEPRLRIVRHQERNHVKCEECRSQEHNRKCAFAAAAAAA